MAPASPTVVVVIEDEESIADAVAARLRSEGFVVHVAGDGPDGVALVERVTPDLVVLDLMLPGFDGLEVCRRIQRDRPVPVLMLTARDSETDLLVGLAVGADDYVTKPFSPRELVARIRAILRRAEVAAPAGSVAADGVDDVGGAADGGTADGGTADGGTADGDIRGGDVGGDVVGGGDGVGGGHGRGGDTRGGDVPSAAGGGALVLGNVEADAVTRKVRRDGELVHLTPIEFDLLHFLGRRPGVVFTRDQLLAEVWGYRDGSGARTVDSHIRALRQKLGPELIRTVHGVGYAIEVGA